MFSLVVSALTGAISFLVSFLPLSPFQDLSVPDTLDTALGWLNWFCPMTDLMAVFTAWLVCMGVWATVRLILDTVIDFGEGVAS